MKLQTFKKEEKLCHKKKIDALFDKSNESKVSFARFPVRLVAQEAAGSSHTQVLFSVSKRRFKRAVDRNVIKRRMREAYRLNKQLIAIHQKFDIAFLYTSPEIQTFEVIQASLKKLLQQLKEKSAS